MQGNNNFQIHYLTGVILLSLTDIYILIQSTHSDTKRGLVLGGTIKDLYLLFSLRQKCQIHVFDTLSHACDSSTSTAPVPPSHLDYLFCLLPADVSITVKIVECKCPA